MYCTAPALAPRFTLPQITIPPHLHAALKNIYLKSNCLVDSSLCNNYMRFIESLPNVQKITYSGYLITWKTCLYLIHFDEDLKLKQYTRFNYAVKKSEHDNDHFIISMKYVNSDFHVIKSNLNVTLKETVTNKVVVARVMEVQGKDVIIKALCPMDAKILGNENSKFDINFWDVHWSLRCCHYALSILSTCNWIEIAYPRARTACTDMEIDIEWINTNMKENERQKQAVRKILSKTSHPAPYIIFGPPGTGKTATLVEAICQILTQLPTENILVCTASNAAADEITKRLIEYIPKKLIYRMYAPSRERSTVDKQIQPCANFVGDTTVFLSKELLLLKKVVITTLVSSTRLIRINFRENHFSYIIIDEASQAIEPEMLIPLIITKASEGEKTGFQPQVVIAGDPYQLGPVVCCKRIEHLLGRSMLERLMNDCDPYKKQDGKYNSNYITKLVKNYRSHESLLYVSNKQFYDNELEMCGGADTRMALNWSQLPNKNFPMIFQEVLGTEKRTATHSACNTAEVLAVLMYVDMLIKTGFVKRAIIPKDIGIVTPFKQQQQDISRHLTAMNLKDITVGTVETFQGQERNVMILSTVRSQIFEHDGKEHIGFLSSAKRFNVALTRAKALMIIIGNPNILCTNKHWKVLVKYCEEHNAYIPFKQLPLNEEIVAKLKRNTKVTLYNRSGAKNTTKLSVTLEQKEEIETFDKIVRKIKDLKLNRGNN
ncbi:PREDICTED: putative helicase mov-10-B.1 isoform X2 [Vollenhovia emeryi]|nr:PREDICTED: putative helicase mov-10-B.1 isoform X2 [Vollenhovia emeryi]